MPDNITKPDPAIARIDAFRQRARVSLRDAAPLVGVSYSTLSQYNTGDIDPPLSVVRAYATAFGAVLDVREVGHAELAPVREDLQPQQQAVLDATWRAVGKLNDEDARVILHVLDKFLR